MLFQCLNIGKQHLLQKFMRPIFFSVHGVFLIFSLLHVSFLWIELATAVELSSNRSLVRSRKILITLGTFFFCLVIASFFSTANYVWVYLICCMYAVLVIVAFTLGSLMITKKLEVCNDVEVKKASGLRTGGRKVFPATQRPHNMGIQKHRTEKKSGDFLRQRSRGLQATLTIPSRLQKANRESARKVILYSRSIAIHCTILCLAVVGAFVFDSPSHQLIHLNFVMVGTLNGRLVLLWILLYLSRGNASTTCWRKKKHTEADLVQSINKFYRRKGSFGSLSP